MVDERVGFVISARNRASQAIDQARASLERLKKSARDTAKELQKPDKVATGLTRSIGGISQSSATLTIQLLNLQQIAVGVFRAQAQAVAALTVDISRQTTAVGNLARQFQTSAGFISELNFAAASVGATSSDVEQALGDLQQRAANIEQDFTRWGISVRDVRGELLPIEGILQRFSDRMAEASNETEAFAAADELGGDSLRRLLPLLRDGNAGLQRFLRTARASGATISETSVTIARDFVRSLREAQLSWDNLRRAIFDAVGPQITAAIDFISTRIQALARAARENGESIRTAFVGFLTAIPAVIRAIPPFVSTLNTVIRTISLIGGVASVATGNLFLLSASIGGVIVTNEVRNFAASLETTADNIAELADGVANAAQVSTGWNTVLKPLGDSLESTGNKSSILTERLKQQRAAAERLERQIGSLSNALEATQQSAFTIETGPITPFEAGPSPQIPDLSSVTAEQLQIQREFTEQFRQQADLRAQAAIVETQKIRDEALQLGTELETILNNLAQVRNQRQLEGFRVLEENTRRELEVIQQRLSEQQAIEQTAIQAAIEAKTLEQSTLTEIERRGHEMRKELRDTAVRNARNQARSFAQVGQTIGASIAMVADEQASAADVAKNVLADLLNALREQAIKAITISAAQGAAQSAAAPSVTSTGVAAPAVAAGVIAAMFSLITGLLATFHTGGRVGETDGQRLRRSNLGPVPGRGGSAREGLALVQAGETIRTEGQEMRLQRQLDQMDSPSQTNVTINNQSFFPPTWNDTIAAFGRVQDDLNFGARAARSTRAMAR